MANDPITQAHLAPIQEGAKSERQQRIAAGLNMIQEGHSISAASRAVGIPRRTLSDQHRGVAAIAKESTQGRLEVLLETSLDMAELASDAIKDSLRDEPDTWKPGDLVKLYGVSTDKSTNLSGNSKPQNADAFAGMLTALKEQGITLQAQPKTIEAEAREVEE